MVVVMKKKKKKKKEMYRGDQTITLRSREVGTSMSRLTRVEALIDSIVDDLNHHVSDLLDAETEENIQVIDDQVKEMCDVHLEADLDFDFEELDIDTEHVVTDPDPMPYDPEKEKKLNVGSQRYLYDIQLALECWK